MEHTRIGKIVKRAAAAAAALLLLIGPSMVVRYGAWGTDSRGISAGAADIEAMADIEAKADSETADGRQRTLDTEGLILEVGREETSAVANLLIERKGEFEICWKRTEGGESGERKCTMKRTAMPQEGWYCYTAEITGLIGGISYEYYILETGTGTEKTASAVYQFKAGSAEKTSFLFAGDVQIGAGEAQEDAEGWNAILNKAAEALGRPDFVMTAGDQSDSREPGETILEYVKFRSPDLLKLIPAAVNRGNHETGTGLFEPQFYRFQDKNTPADYFFTRGSALFVAIDSNSGEYDEHVRFLADAIGKAEKKWVIVSMHHSMFGAKDRGEGSKSEKAREAYAEVFSEMGVDLVLSGHDHTYARSYYMKGLTVCDASEGKKEPGEVLYLAGGSPSGSKFYEDDGKDYPYIAYAYHDANQSISWIEITEEQISIMTYGMPGMEVIDRAVITK